MSDDCDEELGGESGECGCLETGRSVCVDMLFKRYMDTYGLVVRRQRDDVMPVQMYMFLIG